jgi:acetyl esterase/lipase
MFRGLHANRQRRPFVCVILCVLVLTTTSAAEHPPPADDDGTVYLPAISLPESALLSDETRRTLANARAAQKERAASGRSCASLDRADATQAAAIEKCEEEAFRASSYYKRLRTEYDVQISATQIRGVHVEIVTPTRGIVPTNKRRVLINVHGGGFLGGWHSNSDLEAVPIASVGSFKVITLDYREAPEYRFPAASEDVAKVYQELLNTYRPKNIGIYGCSAGGLLTAETVAWLEKERLPLPGAVAMLSGAATYWSDGDSGYFGRAMEGTNLFLEGADKNPYFQDASPHDALAFPAESASVMARFPPSLLVTGTRDFALSSVVHTHSVLVAQGVEADLHVWEGLGDAFFYDPYLPESREAYEVIARFFDKHLGR